jgi:TatD DNase family protein
MKEEFCSMNAKSSGTGYEYIEEIERITKRARTKEAASQEPTNGKTFLRFVDAHIHLSDGDYAGCIDEIIEEARMAHVVALVSNSVDLETSIGSLELADTYSGLVHVALGIQPKRVNDLTEGELEKTLDLISKQTMNKALVALGEIGLDSNYAKNWEDQLRVFDKMLLTAEKLGLPVIVHSRGAEAQITDMLPSYNLKRVLLHFFTGPDKALSKAIENDYYISEGPAVAYSKTVQEIARKVPMNSLLTETDGPVRFYKRPFKGKRTTPAFIPVVVKAIADVKNMDVKIVAEKLASNFEQFFTVKLHSSRV